MHTLTNGAHVVETTIAAEAVAYRARGYRDVVEAPEPEVVEIRVIHDAEPIALLEAAYADED